VQCLEHHHNQEVVVVEEAIGVVGNVVVSMAETEDVVVLPLLIRGANVDTTTIQKLRPTQGQLEDDKINLTTRLKKKPQELVLSGEGDVVVHEKNPKGRVGETNNNKNDLNLLKTRRKDGREESHSPKTMSQNPKLLHQLAATEAVLRGVEVCVVEFNHHLP
jgi:hypothetical protein